MIDHCGAKLSQQHAFCWAQQGLSLSAKPARTATVATHAWTKLHAQIISWVSGGVLWCAIYAWPLLPEAPQLRTVHNLNRCEKPAVEGPNHT